MQLDKSDKKSRTKGILYYCNTGVLYLSFAIIPFYLYSARSEVFAGLTLLVGLSLPFFVIQYAAVTGSYRNERWVKIWTPFAVFLGLLSAAATVMSYL